MPEAPRPESAPRARLRDDLPFRRIALVLSGGGALGAYEVGVLRVLETLKLAPALVAGVSIGAVNAAVWLAHGRRSETLEAAWRRLRGSHLGLRWITLALRWLGAALFVVALVELVVTFAGSRELSGSYWLWRRASARLDVTSTVLDAAAWAVLAVLAALAIALSRPIEGLLSRHAAGLDAERAHRVFGRVALGAALLHALVWVFGWPWPHRFSATVVLALAVLWLANRPGRGGNWARAVLFALMPETKGLGLWGSTARRRVIERLVGASGRARLVAPESRLVVSALALDTGRVCHFVNWPDPSPEFRERLAREAGEVRVLRDAEDVLRATLASSAIPGVFEPVRIDGRSFVDAGGFSNQPIHVAMADGADAILVVVLAPSGSPPPAPDARNLFELGGRLLELANWRDLQAELEHLPEGWSSEGRPARICVVEPETALPAHVLAFDPASAATLIERGEADAWRALVAAGWAVEAGARDA